MARRIRQPLHNRRHPAPNNKPNRRTHDRHEARARARAREVTPAPASQDPQLAVWFTPEDIRTSKEGSPYHEKAQTASDDTLEEAALEVLSDSDWLWTVYGEICCEIIDRAHAITAERAARR